jgi:hypothetical protein
MSDTMTDERGFALCDSSAVRAVAVRRLGSLPLCVPLRVCDVGEAKLADGRRVLITWGAHATPESQFWAAHHTVFQPIWCGANDGACEYILGEMNESRPDLEWVWAGLRISQEDERTWLPVGGGE